MDNSEIKLLVTIAPAGDTFGKVIDVDLLEEELSKPERIRTVVNSYGDDRGDLEAMAVRKAGEFFGQDADLEIVRGYIVSEYYGISGEYVGKAWQAKIVVQEKEPS